MASNERISQYLEYLPAIYHQDPFAGRWLLAFERILSGLHPLPSDDPIPGYPGLEELLDRIHTYFDPGPDAQPHERMPKEFLPWLGSWVALSLREDWAEDEKRRFLSRIVSLYRKRGTKNGLKDILHTYTKETVTIYEFDHPTHYFQVEMTLREQDPTILRRKEKIARAIIDQEKPAHTFYSLRILIPSMQIRNDLDEEKNIGIRVGRNTLLGTTSHTL